MLLNRFKIYFHNRLVVNTLNTIVLRGAARGIGSLVPFFIAAWFGVTKITDVFFFVYGIVIFFNNSFATVLENFIVPFIAESRSKNQEKTSFFIGDVLIASALIIISILFVSLFLLKPIGNLFVHFNQESLNLFLVLFIEIVPLMVLIVLSSVLSGALNAYSLFKMPAISPAGRSIITLVIIYVYKDRFGIHSVILGYFLGELFRTAILYHAARSAQLVQFNFRRMPISQIRDFFKTIAFRSSGVLAVAFNPLIDKSMVSWLGGGSITLVDYADKIYSIPVILIVEGFLVVMISHWSHIHYDTDSKLKLKKESQKTCKAIFWVSIFLSSILFLSRRYLVHFIYGGRKISFEQLNIISEILGYYLIGLTPLLIVMTLSGIFLVMKKAKFLMAVGFLNAGLHILFNILFMRIAGIKGVAISTTVVQLVIMIVYWLEYQYSWDDKVDENKY